MARKFLRGLPYVTSTNGRDIPIFMKLCYEFWAYCVNGANQLLTITAASNATPIQITTSTPHNLVTNQLVGIYNVNGNTAANGGYNVTVTGTNTFNLNGTTGNGAFSASPFAVVCVPSGITPLSPTSSPQGFFEGSSVIALGNDGVTSAIGNTLTASASAPFTPSMAGKHVVIWSAGANTGVGGSSVGQTLPQTTINVESTLGFTFTGGTVFVQTSAGVQTVSYVLIPNTTIAALSNGAALPQSTINVLSTAGFPTTGTIKVVTANGPQTVTYTNTTSTTFTGCAGGTGTMSTGGTVAATQFAGCTGGTGTMAANASVTFNLPSTDDSIYRILSAPSNTQLQLIPFTGGTTDISTLKNNLTSRAALSYRVIDLQAGSQLAVASGNYFIGNMVGAPNINSGQSVSQFQFLLRGSSATFGQFGMVTSPNGSWNGSAFSGTGSNTTMSERTSVNNLSLNGGTSNVTGFVSLIADTDFFFGYINSSNSNGSGSAKSIYFMNIIPQRLFTAAQDPNVIASMVGSNGFNTGTGTDSFATSFAMVGFDGTTRTHNLISRNLAGDTANNNIGNSYTVGPGLTSALGYQGRTTQVMMTETLMSSNSSVTAGQFSLARARMRQIRFTFNGLPQYYTVGNSGEYLHIANGLLMPWDGAILPYIFLAGGT